MISRARTSQWTDRLVLVAWLAGIVLVTALAFLGTREVNSAQESKFHEADREILYRVTRDERAASPRFVLSRGEHGLVLVTHGVYPEGANLDANAELLYGLHLRIQAPDGSTFFEHEVWTKTRRSRARLEDGTWLDENAFSTDGNLPIGDDRLLDLSLPPGIPERATIEFRPLGAASEVLMRVYRSRDLTSTDIDPNLADLTGVQARSLGRFSSSVPWLSPDEARARGEQRRWERLASLGEDGTDYTTRVVYHSGFRMPPDRASEAEPFLVTGDYWTAINVEGPARLRLRVDRAPLTMHAITEAGASGEERLLSPGADIEVVAVSGVQTLVFRGPEGSAEHTAALWVDALDPDPRIPFGSMTVYPYERGTRRLKNDPRRFPVYLLADESAHADFALPQEGTPYDRTVRIDVRVIPDRPLSPPPSRTPMREARATVRFENAAGELLAERALTRPSVHAPFERVRHADGVVVPVSEPVSFHVVPPETATRLRVVAEDDVVIRAYAPLPGEDQYESPYAEHASEATLFRYGPRTRRTWIPMRAENHASLAEAQNVSRLVAQVRLEPRGASHSNPALASESDAHRMRSPIELTPVDHPRREHILELLDPGHAWSVGSMTEVTSSLEVRAPERRVDTRLLYWADDASVLGQPLRVSTESGPLLDVPLHATRGAFTMPALAPGVHRLRVSGPPSLRAFVDLPAASRPGHALRRLRTVYRLGPLRVRVPATSQRLFVVVYGPFRSADPDVTIALRIGGESSEFTQPLPASDARESAPFTDVRGETAGYPRLVAFTLPATSESSSYVSITQRGGGELWARVLAYDAALPLQSEVVAYRGRTPRGPDEAE